MAEQATLAVEMSQQLVCFSAKGGNNVGSPVMLVCVMECRPNIVRRQELLHALRHHQGTYDVQRVFARSVGIVGT